MIIRRAQASDRAEHARMRLALWPDEDAAELEEETEAWLGMVDPDHVTFVAERTDGGGLCGFAEASVVTDESCQPFTRYLATAVSLLTNFGSQTQLIERRWR